MPRVRAVVIVIACAVGAVLGMGTFALAQVASGCGGSSGTGLAWAPDQAPAPDQAAAGAARPVGCEERLGAAVSPDAAMPVGTAHGVPASTATRHISAPGERTGRRADNPATDRAMALLIGWGTLVLICGGLCCGRRRREDEPAAEGHPPEVRVRVQVPRQRSGAPRHLLAAPPHRPGERGRRPGLSRAIACVISSPWREMGAGGGANRAAGGRELRTGRTGASAQRPVAAPVVGASAHAGPPAAGGAPVRAPGAVAGRAARAGETVMMRRIVLPRSVAAPGVNDRRS